MMVSFTTQHITFERNHETVLLARHTTTTAGTRRGVGLAVDTTGDDDTLGSGSIQHNDELY